MASTWFTSAQPLPTVMDLGNSEFSVALKNLWRKIPAFIQPLLFFCYKETQE